jgi:hypothetical protein
MLVNPPTLRRGTMAFGISNAFRKAKSLLKPYPDELMDAHDVSPVVNSAKYDGAECIRPVSDDEIVPRLVLGGLHSRNAPAHELGVQISLAEWA